jgi:hypothetical protein
LEKGEQDAENQLELDNLPDSGVRFGAWTVNITIISVVIFSGVLIYKYVDIFGSEISNKQEVWGQFGDYIGGVMNPLIGMFTLVLLLQNLDLQRKLLHQTREQVNIAKKEYKLTRQELERSATALVEQSATLRQQAKEAESRFLSQKDDEWYFQLLKMRSEMIGKLHSTATASGKQLFGAECFREWVQELINNHIRRQEAKDSTPRSNEQYAEATEQLLSLHTNSLYPYLRFMQAFVASVGHHDPAGASTIRKYALIATQFSEAEATLLGCYALLLNNPAVAEQMRKLGVIGTTLTSLHRDFENGLGVDNSVLYDALLNHLQFEFTPNYCA